MSHRNKNIKPAKPHGLELRKINRKRNWIVVTSVLALMVLAMAILQAPPSAVVIVALIILISIKKAAISYTALGKKKADLMGHSVS
jgi:bacteriorhodopsin